MQTNKFVFINHVLQCLLLIFAAGCDSIETDQTPEIITSGASSDILTITSPETSQIATSLIPNTTVPTIEIKTPPDQMVKLKMTATFLIIKNYGHSFIPTGGALSPSQDEINEMIADFFDQSLK
jgi:hypothetical protein